MTNPPLTKIQTVKLGLSLCLAGAGLGAIGLIGWFTGVNALVTVVPGQPPMMPNTAAALLLLGSAAALHHPKSSSSVVRSLSALVAIIVLAIGLVTIAEYALDLPFSIDQLLVRTEAGPYPGRPSPWTALALTFLAIAILLSEWRPAERFRPSEWLILGAGVIAFTVLLGQLFGAGELYLLAHAPVIGVAVPTALGLLMISVGLLLEQPDAAIMGVATSSGPGGMLVRRLSAGAILVPVLFGLIAVRLVAPGAEDVSLMFAVIIAMSSIVSLWLLTTTAEHVNRTHDALEHSRAQTRDLVELGSDGIFLADLEGHYIDVNAAACRMLGYSRDELLGMTILDLIPPEDEARLRHDKERLLQGGTAVGEWRILMKDRTYLPVEVSAKILPGGRWQAFVRDISERKRAREALRQTQERIELALNGADLASWDWNIITGEVIANPRCAEMRGFHPEELNSDVDSYFSGIHPDDLPAFRRAVDECFEGISPVFECEYRASTKSGDWVWILSRGKVFGRDERARPIRMVGTALDVTARKRTEEALRQTQERLDLALEAADLGTWDWNVTTGEVILSSRCAEMREFRPQEIRYDVDAHFAGIHPEDLPVVKKAASDCLEGICPEFECEFRAPTKSGAWIWMFSRGKVIGRDEKGRPTRMAGTGLNVTARKNAEDLLRQTQERMELALKGADLASWDWNVITGEVVFNPRWAEMRGFRPEEIPPHVDSCLASIHPDDRPAVHKSMNDCLEGARPDFECEYRAATKSGEWIWVLDRGKVFGRDERGRATRMVGTELDVTVHKRAEEALRQSEAKFSGIVSISADAIISIDEDQRIILFNEGAEKIFGRSRTEAIGAPLDILIPERFRGVRHHVENFAAGPDTARRMGMGSPIYGVRKNGEEFSADAAISKIVIGGKRILTVTLRDITEQKQVETEQRVLAELGAAVSGALEFEDRLTNLARLLVNDLADLCILDLIEDDGGIRRARVACKDPTLDWMSDAFMRPAADREQPHVAGSVFETGQGVLIQNVTPDVISSWTRTDEDRTALLLQGAGFQSAIGMPLMARGKVLGTVSLLSLSRVYGPADLRVVETIAQRASLLLDNARLFDAAKQAIQARDEILGIVAHDLRNPLAAIVALAAVLRRNGPEREVGEEIEHAVNRMSRLIQDLIDVTRIEAGHRLSLRPARLHSAEVASHSFEAQTRLTSLASLELRLEVAPDLPDIWADRDRLLQVFENLIGNATKFTKPGGQITLGATVREGEVVFSLADTGSGIASNRLPHVFDRFWQAPQDKRRGTGLGLAIVKGIVEAHGGRIWVQSTPGQGSTFFFTIPTTQAARSHGAPALHGPS